MVPGSSEECDRPKGEIDDAVKGIQDENSLELVMDTHQAIFYEQDGEMEEAGVWSLRNKTHHQLRKAHPSTQAPPSTELLQPITFKLPFHIAQFAKSGNYAQG